MRDSPIIAFDSGIGSISIINELRRQLPKENLIYFADKANFPYGNKSHNELLTIVQNTIKYLERFNPKLIIMASNTPSVQILDELTDKIDIPIVGVRPPLKEAVKLTKKNHIGIMATQSTINSIQLDRQIKDEIPQNIFVSKLDASPLITLIENGMFINNKKKQKR